MLDRAHVRVEWLWPQQHINEQDCQRQERRTEKLCAVRVGAGRSSRLVRRRCSFGICLQAGRADEIVKVRRSGILGTAPAASVVTPRVPAAFVSSLVVYTCGAKRGRGIVGNGSGLGSCV